MHSSSSRQSTEQAENALLACISARDRSAMDRLHFLYFTRLTNFFLHVTAHAHLVEELISDTMFELWRAAPTIGANASASVTIMGLAYTRAQKHLAEASASRPHLQRASPAADHVRPHPLDSLRKLPVEERAVLHLAYAGGHSRREIGEIMHISCEYVDELLCDARLRRAKLQVRTSNRD